MALLQRTWKFKSNLRSLNASRPYQRSAQKDDYMYIQKSVIPTMHFQPSLPRLPIPKLELTCERYLASQKALLTEEHYRKTEANVLRFRDTLGRELQHMLKDKDKQQKHTSYISQPWFDMYLTIRKPLPVNFNPMLVFQNDQRSEYNNQLIRATNMLISSLRFYKSLNAGILEPEVFHLNPKKSDTDTFRTVCSKVPAAISWYVAYLFNAYPLDMSQYSNLFNATRIPEINKDRIYRASDARHILIQHKGHFYVFDVLDKSGDILPVSEILARLHFVLNDKVSPAEFPVGVLTTLERNKWAALRHNLSALGNHKALEMIDTALFNLCLDDEVLGDNLEKCVRQFLHADGKNRWFDKSLSLQVTKDGVAGVNFEHSWGDGVAVLRYFQDIYKDTITNPQVHPDTRPYSDDISKVQRLGIKLDDSLKAQIKETARNYEAACGLLDINFIELHGIGRKVCKKYNISPDAVMQMSFQAAYHKQYNKFVASYESCSTAAFRHGRTETIRPCTVATKVLSEAINSRNKPSSVELRNLISECSKVHVQLTREAAMGQGFDRHLFALKLLASESNNKDQQTFFEDPAYHALQHNIISTSTLSSAAVRAGGFGPVVDDGFGISYVIKDDYIGTLVTSYPQRDGREFINCLQATIDEIIQVLNSTK